MTTKQKIFVGVLGKTKGLQGWIRIHLHNPDSALMTPGTVLHVENHHPSALEIEEVSHQAKAIVVRFKNFTEISNVEPLVSQKIFVYRDQLPELDGQEYYHVDLEGCTVVDENQQHRGKIANVISTSANDVLSVIDENGAETLIPFVKAFIERVDLTKKTVFVTWPKVFS
ncbi:MAG: 16S rRNA processing protein RimM [Bdellovibrionales bacterium]|nr:16S rRNA processing protein RimM [Bdellovibrionales bacterium]